MKLDNPQEPEFASWRSYANFASRVRRKRRYVWEAGVNAFLDTVLATLKGRDVSITEGQVLFRAQRGVDRRGEEGENRTTISAFGPKRMKPQNDRATEGRANPVGIPVLYLASTEKTAISEIRPWIGSELSVAQFRVVRDLRALNLSKGYGKTPVDYLTFEQFLEEEPADRHTKETAVWTEIDQAFSRPVARFDDIADYAPTQILAELFRNNGYDALVYRSQFGETGYNIVLFDVDNAEAINAAPYTVTAIEVEFKEIGDRWFFDQKSSSERSTRPSGQ